MSTLEQEIGKLVIKDQQATQKFCELRDLLVQIKQDIEVIKAYQKHFTAHFNDTVRVQPNNKQ